MDKVKFEKLRVWNLSMGLGEELNLMIKDSFPESEKFNLSSQMLKAIDSVALNIAEGSIGQSNPKQRKFLPYSIRSLAETVTCLHKARRRAYISEEIFQTYYQKSYDLLNMLSAFRSKV